MYVSLSQAKAQLTELARRAEAGEEIVLTRHGKPRVRLVPVEQPPAAGELDGLLRALHGAAGMREGSRAARSADFLYGDDGLPA